MAVRELEDLLRERGFSYRTWQRARQELREEEQVVSRCEMHDGKRTWYIAKKTCDGLK